MRLKILMMFLFPFGIYSQVISLEEFIKYAQENDPQFELLLSERDKLKYLVDLGLPTRSLLLTVKNEYGFNSQSNTRNLTAQVSKNILETGTTLTATQSFTDRPDRTEKVLQLRLEQALIKNFFGRNLRLQKDIVEKQAKKLKLDILDLYDSYISDIGKLFFSFSEAFYNYELAKSIYEESKELEKNVIARKRKNVATQIDLDRATLQVLMSKQDLISKKNEYLKSLANTEKILGRKLNNIRPNLPLPKMSFEKIKNINFQNLREYKKGILDKRILEESKKVAQRVDDPELSLIIGYNKDDSSRFNTPINREEKVVGLEFAVPFGDSKANAGEMQAALQLRQSKLRLKLIENQLQTSFVSAKTELVNLKELLDLSRSKTAVTERILKAEEKRYQYGNQTLEKLIETKKDFTQYRYDYYAALIAYNKKILDWKNLFDELIPNQENIF